MAATGSGHRAHGRERSPRRAGGTDPTLLTPRTRLLALGLSRRSAGLGAEEATWPLPWSALCGSGEMGDGRGPCTSVLSCQPYQNDGDHITC